MAKNDELGMGMFEDFDSPIELNLDDAPAELKELLEKDESDDNADDSNTDDNVTNDSDENLNEDDNNPEGVVEKDEEEGDNQDDSPNLYSSFATVLQEQGLLPSLDPTKTEIKDIESLVNVFKSEFDNQAKEYLVNKLGQEGYEALEKGVTLAEYQTHVSNTQTLESITEDSLKENSELCKNIILQDYINQGIDQNRAERILKKTIDLGDEAILEDAVESLKSLKAFEQQELIKIQKARAEQRDRELAEQEAIDNDLKNAIYTSKEIIDGIKLDKAIQDKVYKSITSIVGQSPQGIMENKLMRDRRENPIEFDTKLYYLYELTNGFKDFSKIVNKSESKAVSRLEQSLRQTNFKEQGGNPAYLDDPESYGGSQFGSELVL